MVQRLRALRKAASKTKEMQKLVLERLQQAVTESPPKRYVQRRSGESTRAATVAWGIVDKTKCYVTK